MPDPSELLAEYERTTIEIELPDSSSVSTSLGQPPPPELSRLLPLTVISAWNPGAERPGLDANRAAHEELLVRLLGWAPGSGPLQLLKAVGRSQDGSHSEDSVAVHGLQRTETIALGRRMGQAAIFEITFAGASVVDCGAPPSELAAETVVACDALAAPGTYEYFRCFLSASRLRLVEAISQVRSQQYGPDKQLSKRVGAVLGSGATTLSLRLDLRGLNVDNPRLDSHGPIGQWRTWVVSLIDVASLVRTDDEDADRGPDIVAALNAALAIAALGRLPQHLESARRGPAMIDVADPIERLLSSMRLDRRSVGWGRDAAATAFHKAAGTGLVRWHLLHLSGLHVVPEGRVSPDERARRERPLRPEPPPAPKPDLRDLVCGQAEHSLIFAPRDLVADVRRARSALGEARTWGDARRLLPHRQFAELCNELLARVEPDPPDDQPLDLSRLQTLGPWPRLYYSQIPDWLPQNVISEHGKYFATMMDTGVIFDDGDAEEIFQALAGDGISVEWDDGDLDGLFISSEV